MTPFDLIASLATGFADWVATAADHYRAAAIYQQLSRLSEVELQRHGLARATLASDLCQACDRGNPCAGRFRTTVASPVGP